MKRKLGAFETSQTITEEYAPFNAVGVFLLSNGPSPKRIGEGLRLIQQRHPLLRMRITKEKSDYVFISEGTPEIPLEVIERKNNDHWKSVAEEELNRKFDTLRGPLMRCVHLSAVKPDSSSEIILCFHHAIIDATSVFRVAHELLQLCQTNQPESQETRFTALPLLRAEEEFFPPSFKGPRRIWHALLFMARQVADEICYRQKTRGQTMPSVDARARCRIFPAQLSEEDTERFIRFCRKNRVSLTSCLSAALLLAVSRFLYKNQNIPLRHIFFADLRPYLKPPVTDEHLGSYHSVMRLTVSVKAKQDFWDLAQQINQKIYKSAKRGDKFISPLMSVKMMRIYIESQKMRMGTTALSYPGVTPIPLRYGDIQVKSLHGFVSNVPIGPELTATARIFNKQIYLDFLYLDSDMDQNMAAVIVDEIMMIVKTADARRVQRKAGAEP